MKCVHCRSCCSFFSLFFLSPFTTNNRTYFMRRSARLRQQQQQHQEVDTALSPAQRPQRPPKPGKRRAASPTPTKSTKRRASAAVVASPPPPPQAPTADQAPKERDPPLLEAPDKELAPEIKDAATYPLGDVSHAMVDALFQLGNLDDLIIDDPTVAIDPNAAQSALNLNERMQTLVRKQIDAIHKRILKNDEAMVAKRKKKTRLNARDLTLFCI
ncbi:hypothetical protein BC940DRAFT_43464 [Gongronella butleri]|nr:hypothetical protein BC940DRAFT_43464 [Gongronella butleri]